FARCRAPRVPAALASSPWRTTGHGHPAPLEQSRRSFNPAASRAPLMQAQKVAALIGDTFHEDRTFHRRSRQRTDPPAVEQARPAGALSAVAPRDEQRNQHPAPPPSAYPPSPLPH